MKDSDPDLPLRKVRSVIINSAVRTLSVSAVQFKGMGLAFLLGLVFATPLTAEIQYADDTILADAVVETSRRLTRIDGKPVCFPRVDSANLVILSTYEGGLKFGPATLNHRSGLVEVIVTATEAPIYLFLAGAEPIVWRIVADEDVQIAGVALSGYHPQQVLELPPSVPLGSRAFKQEGPPRQQQACVHEVELSPEQERILTSQTFQTIESVLRREQLLKVLDAFGDFELFDHQYEYGSDARLVFEVDN